MGDTSSCCMVYSTCSVSIYENEDVIQYALSKRDIQIIDTGMTFGIDGYTKYNHLRYHPSMKLCKRYYPHTYNMDGFFICKIKKLSNRKKDQTDPLPEDDPDHKPDIAVDESIPGANHDQQKKSKYSSGGTLIPKKRKTSHDTSSPPAPRVSNKSAPSTSTSMNTTTTTTKSKPKSLNAKMTKPRRLKHKSDVDQV